MQGNQLFYELNDLTININFPIDHSNQAGFLSINILFFGILLVISELNILLRYLFTIFGLKPLAKSNIQIDEVRYKTGRVIGILERIFIYIFTLAGQYAAIGFILTAKGIARFKEFENRTFAEYFLIGTLLSALLALIAALLVLLLLS